MHLTVSLAPLTYADLIGRELRRVAALEIALRRRVPWSVDDDPARVTRIEGTVRDCLQALERHFDVAKGLEAERCVLRPGGDGTASGELAANLGSLFQDGAAPPPVPVTRMRRTAAPHSGPDPRVRPRRPHVAS